MARGKCSVNARDEDGGQRPKDAEEWRVWLGLGDGIGLLLEVRVPPGLMAKLGWGPAKAWERPTSQECRARPGRCCFSQLPKRGSSWVFLQWFLQDLERGHVMWRCDRGSGQEHHFQRHDDKCGPRQSLQPVFAIWRRGNRQTGGLRARPPDDFGLELSGRIDLRIQQWAKGKLFNSIFLDFHTFQSQ